MRPRVSGALWRQTKSTRTTMTIIIIITIITIIIILMWATWTGASGIMPSLGNVEAFKFFFIYYVSIIIIIIITVIIGIIATTIFFLLLCDPSSYLSSSFQPRTMDIWKLSFDSCGGNKRLGCSKKKKKIENNCLWNTLQL